ncbi:MAG TPA: anti-sigma factor [Casimicrobiaceae bacterium]|nr:anti-sigma factor [Casimicrobiaceae bacterium]
MTRPSITDDDLQAFADRQLPADRKAALEQALAQDPALAAKVADIERQNAWLRGTLDDLLDEPLPKRLIDAARPPREARHVPRWFATAAVSMVTLAIGVAGGWYWRDAQLELAGTPTTFAQQAAFTHALYASDVNRPVEMWAPEEKRLVTWLSKRLDYELHVPDLNSVGYALVGGRLVAGNERPTALFMYENAAKDRLTLQARKQPPGTDETAFRYAVEDGVGVYYWVDDQCAYAVSGRLDRAKLLEIGRLVYAQLNTREPGK